MCGEPAGVTRAGWRDVRVPLLTGVAARFHEFDARRWDNGGVWLRQ